MKSVAYFFLATGFFESFAEDLLPPFSGFFAVPAIVKCFNRLINQLPRYFVDSITKKHIFYDIT
jgi:hypothetical protein